MFDPLSWALGYILGKGANWLLEKSEAQKLQRRLSAATDAWGKTLPSEANVVSQAMFPALAPHDGAPCPPALHDLRLELARRVPSTQTWHSALLEHWRIRRDALGSDAQSLFRLSEADASPHLLRLAETLHQVLVASQPHFQQEVVYQLQRLTKLVTRDRGYEDTEPDRAIDEACEFFTKKRQPLTAVAMLRRLQDRKTYQSARLRYRLHANIGNALLMSDCYSEAVEEFEKASSALPGDPKAQVFHALALCLSENTEEAHRCAGEILNALPDDERLLNIWVRTAPADTPTDQLLRRIPKSLRHSPPISSAISQHMAAQGHHDEAVAFSSDAHLSSASGPEAAAELACRILERETAPVQRGNSAPTDCSKPNLERVVALFTEALNSTARSSQPLDIATLRLNRSIANRLLGRWPEAIFDSKTAHELDPSSVELAVQHALNESLSGNLQEAIATLVPYEDRLDTGQTCLLAGWLLSRDQVGDAHHAAALVESQLDNLKNAPPFVRLDLLRNLVDSFERAARHTDLLRLLRQRRILNSVDSPTVNALRARAFYHKGDTNRSAAEAKLLRIGEHDDISLYTLRFCAEQLQALGMHEEALVLFKRIATPDSLGSDAAKALEAAQLCTDYGYILWFCERLRANGVYEERCAHLEVDTALRFNEFEKAKEILAQVADAIPKISSLAIRLYNLQTYLGEPGDESALLRAHNEADASGAPQMTLELVRALRHSRHRDLAPELAYRLWRAHPDDKLSHQAIIAAFMPMPAPQVSVEEASRINQDCAVAFTVDGSSDTKWIVMERDDPMLAHDERSPESELGQKLVGKRSGDTFDFGTGPLGQRTATITQVMHKFVKRYQDSMERWADLFPDDPFVWSMKVPTKEQGGDIDGDAFSEQMKTLLKRDDIREVARKYADNFLPLNLFARARGKSVFEATLYAASEPTIEVRCCHGTSDEQKAVAPRLSSCPALVLDSTALATIYISQATDLLKALPFGLITSSGTLEALRAILERGSGDTLYLSGERLAMVRSDNPVLIEERSRFRHFVSEVGENVAIEGGSSLLDLNAEHRRLATESLGTAGAECLALSRRDGRVLWTDDLFTAELAKHFHGVERTWTQATLQSAALHGSISWPDSNTAGARILGFGYFFLPITAEIIRSACVISDWNPSSAPLSELLRWLGHPRLLSEGVALTTVQTLHATWRAAPLLSLAEDVGRSLASSIARRPDGRQILQSVYNAIDQVFGVDVVAAERIKTILTSCIDSHG